MLNCLGCSVQFRISDSYLKETILMFPQKLPAGARDIVALNWMIPLMVERDGSLNQETVGGVRDFCNLHCFGWFSAYFCCHLCLINLLTSIRTPVTWLGLSSGSQWSIYMDLFLPLLSLRWKSYKRRLNAWKIMLSSF